MQDFEQQISLLLPARTKTQNKGNFGRVLLIGGSIGMTGAPCMSAAAALRCGTGLVTVGVPASLNEIFEIKLTEAMTVPLPDYKGLFDVSAAEAVRKLMDGFNVIAFGMGARLCDGTRSLLKMLLREYEGILLLDADGLNALAEDLSLLQYKKGQVIVTPHPGEMSRLCGMTVLQVQQDREGCARSFAQKQGCIVVLKGHRTVITDGDTVYLNTTGNVGMATGGTGDVLSGMIASFAGQGVQPLESCALGCYLHGLAGDIGVSKKNIYSLIATDVIENIPDAINILLQNSGKKLKTGEEKA